MFSMNVMFEIP